MPALLSLIVSLLPGFCVPAVPTVAFPGPVVRPFVAPACPRCAGHRGITFAVAPGSPVRALAPGIVTFDGAVAGRRFVVVRTPGGDLVTYGDLTGPAHGRGETVIVGDVVGESGGLVYVGTRRGGAPVDPRWVLGLPGPRLVAPAALACPVGPLRLGR